MEPMFLFLVKELFVVPREVLKGKVTMDANYSLSEEEVKEGYILGCQARPASVDVVVDFDEV